MYTIFVFIFLIFFSLHFGVTRRQISLKISWLVSCLRKKQAKLNGSLIGMSSKENIRRLLTTQSFFEITTWLLCVDAMCNLPTERFISSFHVTKNPVMITTTTSIFISLFLVCAFVSLTCFLSTGWNNWNYKFICTHVPAAAYLLLILLTPCNILRSQWLDVKKRVWYFVHMHDTIFIVIAKLTVEDTTQQWLFKSCCSFNSFDS